jgi:hypothetical protein
MAIRKNDLEQMNDLVAKGATIAQLAKKFTQYDYWDIYWEVSDYSLLGKKRSITNRLNKLKKSSGMEERRNLIKEVGEFVDDIYKLSKINGKKLIEIDKTLRK